MKTLSMKFVWGVYLKLRAEGDTLRAEGDTLWAEGILEAYGNVTFEWKSGTHCIVDGVDEFKEE